jgi:hypothetical protein
MLRNIQRSLGIRLILWYEKRYEIWHMECEEFVQVRVTYKDPGTDGNIILKWIFKRLHRGTYTGPIWLRIKKNEVGSFESSDEPLGPIKCGEFL